MNKLLFGDNLTWLRDPKVFPDASVDLVYLDPPFNSNADYNVLFREASGEASQAQFHAFTDTWNWADAAQTYAEFVDTCPNTAVVEMVEALHSFLKNSPMMAYLAMMAPRLVELHRVLKPTGSLYLHCDPTASHYLKMILDGVFGAKNFKAEIIWKRHNARSTDECWPHVHDIILFYGKSNSIVFHETKVPGDENKVPHTLITGADGNKYQTYELTAPGRTKEGESGKPWRGFNVSEMGRHWANVHSTMDEWADAGLIHFPKNGGFPRRRDSEPFVVEARTITVGDVWIDIDRLNQTAKERLGYPTQKPQALLERIIEASSNKGDIVLDPFCGCGTTIHAAQKLGRQWIGIDVTYLAINLIKRRLKDAFGADVEFEEHGDPKDFGSARQLFKNDPWQFQQWALSKIDARPRTEGDGKGADRGVDGMLYFYDYTDESRRRREESLTKKPDKSLVTSTPTKSKEEPIRQKILVQVKGGGVQRNDISTLLGDVNNQKFVGGILITLEKPTKPMREEAADAGRYESKLWHDKDYPKIQILTIEGLLSGKERVEAPPQMNPFARAQREGKAEKQTDLI